MATAKSDAPFSLREKFTYAWDWPIVPGRKFSDEERQNMKNLSSYFTTIAAVGAGSLAALNNTSTLVTFSSAAAAVIAGHYLAGAVIALRH